MTDALHEKMETLARLRIERAQRPASSRRGLWALAALLVAVGALGAGAAWWYYRTTGVSIAAALARKVIDVNVLLVPRQPQATQPIALVASGRIVSDVRVNVATKVSGQITELLVEQGDPVEKGQVLARIEDVVYRAQRDEAAATLAQRAHDIVRREAELARAQAAILQARAEAEFRRRDFERLEQLFRGGQASELEYLNARNLHEAAAAAVEVAVAAADSARASVQMARTEREAADAVLRVWQKRLDDCAIRAPIGGVVLERNAQVGDFLAAEGGRGANANAQLVSIADMSLLRVEIDVSERDVHRVHAGQRAVVTADADRSTYDGDVMWVDPIGDYARATVQVKVRVREPGRTLRVDGSAKVEFLADTQAASQPGSQPQSLWLPKQAVQLTPGSEDALVFTVAGGRAVANKVRLGARTDDQVEVRSGVSGGMELICENLAEVEDGSPVRVVKTVQIGDL